MSHFRSLYYFALFCLTSALTATTCLAAPAGYVKQTIPLGASPLGLTFDNDGTLYALTNPAVNNELSIRVINADYSFGTDLTIAGDDSTNFYVGGMTYDPVSDSLLITDNTTDGRLYSVSKTGVKQTLAIGIPAISDVAVRSTGEIFVSTALGDNAGEVLQVKRSDGSTSSVATGLDYGAGLAFDSTDNLIVQDSDAVTYQGRLARLPISGTSGNLQFGSLELLLDGMQSSAGVAIDSEGDLFTTGSGGLFAETGSPLAETLFDGDTSQFATAIDFDAGSRPFEPFAGPDGGRLALMANFGFTTQDDFITLFTPLPSDNADFDGSNFVDGADLNRWQLNYGATEANLAAGDANADERVDGSDFLIWQRQYAPLAIGAAAVPEPSTFWLIATSWCALLAKRARNRKL